MWITAVGLKKGLHVSNMRSIILKKKNSEDVKKFTSNRVCRGLFSKLSYNVCPKVQYIHLLNQIPEDLHESRKF